MSDRIDITTRTYEDGKPAAMHLVVNPVIDDILCVEMRLQAYETQTGKVLNADRRVGRDVRDFLIRIGVIS